MSEDLTTEVDVSEIEMDELAELLGSVVGVNPPQNWVKAEPMRRGAFSSRSQDSQRRVYESNLEELSERVNKIKQDLKAKAYGDPVPATVAEPARRMLEAEKKAGQFASKANYMEANRQILGLQTALAQTEQAGEVAKAIVAMQAEIKTVDETLYLEAKQHAAKKFMKPATDLWEEKKRIVAQGLQGPLDLQTVSYTLHSTHIKGARNFLKAKLKMYFPRELKKRQDDIAVGKKSIDYANQYQGRIEVIAKFEDWSTVWGEYTSARDNALLKASNLTVDFDFEEIDQAHDQLHQAVDKLAPAFAAVFASDMAMEKTSDFRNSFESTLDAIPSNVMSHLPKDEKWCKKVDDMVKSIGSKANTEEEKKLMQLAITSRFGPNVSGDFSAKNIVSLYKILTMVPVEHVRSKSLEDIKCHTFDDDYVAGDYSSSDKRIRIGAGMTGDNFKSTTLHEVGHAVDDQKGVMKKGGDGKCGPAEYGNWKEETVDSVANAIYDHFSSELSDDSMWAAPQTEIFRLIAAPSKKEVVDYLIKVLGGNDSAEVEGDLDGLLKFKLDAHKCVEICKAIRLSNKHWDQGDSAASSNKIGDRVYQQAYESTWVSYEFAQRKASKIRNYTYRAPGEWFADAYDSFYRKKLNKKHPAYEFLAQDKASLTN